MSTTNRKILVPVDGFPASLKALQIGKKFAELHGSDLVVLNVVEPVSGLYEFFSEDDLKGKRKKYGKEVVTKSAATIKPSSVTITEMVMEGKPYNKVLELVESMDVEMVVMGTNGSRTFGDNMLGSNVAKVIRNAKVPVISVPSDLSEPEFKKVLLPIDPEFGAIELERYLYAWHKAYSPDVELLTVLKDDEDIAEAHKYLNAQKFALNKAGLTNISTRVIVGPDAAYAILNYAKDEGHDFIWMETHGRAGINEWLFGSVTMEVMNESPIPVLSLYPEREPIVRYYSHPNLPI